METMTASVPRMFPVVFLLLLSLWSRGYSQCLRELHTESELLSAANMAQSQSELIEPSFQQSWLFPSLVFNCTGSIYKWRVVAFEVPGNEDRNGRPVLFTWQQTPGSSVNYDRNGSRDFDNCPVQVQGNVTVYESVPDTLLPFVPGDVLGWFLRPVDIARYQPYLRRVESTLSYYNSERRAVPTEFAIESNSNNHVLPLMSIKICVANDETGGDYPKCSDIDLEAERRDAADCIPTPMTPTMGTTPSPSSSSSSLSKGVLIVIIVVPTAVLILLLVTAILVVVFCCLRREPDNHPKSYPNEVPATELVPVHVGNGIHGYEYPGSTEMEQPPLNSVIISASPPQPSVAGSKENQGAAYEEPMLLMSQVTNDMLSQPPPLPPPLHSPAAFSGRGSPNFPLVSPLTSQTPPTTFRDRHSPLPPIPMEAIPSNVPHTFYHTLERPEHGHSPHGSAGTLPISRMKSPEWTARHRLDSSSSRRMRARSVDELSQSSEWRSHLRPFDNHLSVAGIVAGGSHPHISSQGQYHTLEGPDESHDVEVGIYVPTQEQRSQCLSQYEPLFDDNIYSCLKMASNSPLAFNFRFFEESDTYWKPASDTTQLYLQLASKKYREIIRKQVKITEHLGSGEFGTVCKGMWRGHKGNLDVAVKMLNSKATERDTVRFLQEAAIMGQFRHPNIVRMYGVVTVGDPVMIVLELMKNGDLRQHLKRLRPVPGELVPHHLPQKLLVYCSQIALGMEYLARKEFIHRDLAARNILLTEENVCKIADFGMSRDLDDDNYYISNGGKIPIKWTAPEAIHYRKYSTASDVWSFGVVVYEIWSLGHTPFRHKSPEEAIKLLEEGHRLAPPPGCPKEIYHLMIQCWHAEASARPSFTKVVQTLSQSDEVLLKWDSEEVKLPQPKTLGIPLEVGEQLYPELQKSYLRAPKSEYVEL